MNMMHNPSRMHQSIIAGYPAHLHVDLLPAGQGGGNGRRLMEKLFDALREQGIISLAHEYKNLVTFDCDGSAAALTVKWRERTQNGTLSTGAYSSHQILKSNRPQTGYRRVIRGLSDIERE